MIITKLIGGLGNQMFQYAAGRRASVVNKTELKLDITEYDHQVGITHRVYMLNAYKIHASIATKSEIEAFKSLSLDFIPRSWHRLKILLLRRHYIRQKASHFTHELLNAADNSYLDGYWGSEKYFSDIGEILRKDFTLKKKPDKTNSELIQHIKNCNSVSIHVRRSDYVKDKKTHDFHGVCGLAYYKKAISLITKKVMNPSFFIFSDDPDWCKANFRLRYPTTYVRHNLGKNDCEDMRLMSVCKHNIIANSTFSWWGAWLNRNPDKIIVAPKRWFTNKSINTEDLIPNSWIKI